MTPSLLSSNKAESTKTKRLTKETLFVCSFLVFVTLLISSFSSLSPYNKPRQLLDDAKSEGPAFYYNLMELDSHDRGTPHIGYVHIGKCGGVSVERAIQRTENAIGEQGVVTYHMTPPADEYVSLVKDWVFNIRDPITRMQSNWVYSNPLNSPYRRDKQKMQKFISQLNDCYPSLDEAATKGLASPSTSDTGEGYCPELLRKLFMGELRHGAQAIHYGRGFRYHISPFLEEDTNGTSVIEEKNIYVVRQENIEQDLNAINAAFGGNPTSFRNKIGSYPHFWDYETNTPKRPDSLPYTDRYLSPEGLSNLCWILCDEIQVYKQVLHLAKNLEQDQLDDSMNRLTNYCPKEAAENYHCPMLDNQDWIKQGIPTTDSITIIEEKPLKPMMYTYYESYKSAAVQSIEKDKALLTYWGGAWELAGWEPRVLNEEDAEKHPDYEKLMAIVTDRQHTGENCVTQHDMACYKRWIAMAAAGGGFMSDYDVFPMNDFRAIGDQLPNGGKLTIWENSRPSLVSGTSEEYRRISQRIGEVMAKYIDSYYSGDFKSANTCGSDVTSLRDLYSKEIPELIQNERIFGPELITEWTDEVCKKYKDAWGVHLGHAEMNHALRAPFGQRGSKGHAFFTKYRENCKTVIEGKTMPLVGLSQKV